jgi:hypothetical protein
MDITEIVSKLDRATSPELVATLAGLSLAAAAFFIPNANQTLQTLQARINELDKIIPKGEKHGYNQTQYTTELENLQKQVNGIKVAKKGLITAFMIFTFYVIYTVGFDSWIDENLFTPGLEQFHAREFTFQIIDTAISCIFLGFAGSYLWKGTLAIGNYFDVDFKEEQKRLKEILEKITKK